jgi:hypothetical protein
MIVGVRRLKEKDKRIVHIYQRKGRLDEGFFPPSL